jgi:ABC-type multidrug transport system ATPase subunit
LQDLAYHVPSNKNKKERAYLLKDVSGYIQPHQMTALMGPSGSGKTVSG